jgi:serine/threonine protein phosphatase 1
MTHVLILPENKIGHDFVVGDIHGAYEMLERALAAAKFDPAKDRLISVGDLIDRGPQSSRALEFLNKPWFHAVRGNHEDMFLDIVYEDGTFDQGKAFENIRNGMRWIFDETQESLKALRAAFAKMPIVIETKSAAGTVGFLHAEVPVGMNWPALKNELETSSQYNLNFLFIQLLWSRKRITAQDKTGVDGIDRVFAGHSVQENGPTQLGNCFYVDTGGVFRPLQNAQKYILTLSDITAKAEDIVGPQKNPVDEYKIVLAEKKLSAPRKQPAPKP